MITVVGAVEFIGRNGRPSVVKVLPITVEVRRALAYIGHVWKQRQLLARYEKGDKDVTKG